MFKEGEGMKLKIPIEVDFDDIQSLFDDINHLQTYKLFEGSDELMVCLEDVADVLVKHIKAKEKRQSDHIAEVSKKVSSAQPELAKDINVPSNDCISRQAAIDALDKRFDGVPMELTTEILELRRDLRERIPSAQRTGKWIYGEDLVAMCDGYRCSNCGFFVPWDYQHKFISYIEEYNFCPNCGADMRGEQND